MNHFKIASKIVPVSDDDSLISKKEFFARVDQARKYIAEGKEIAVNGKDALASLLESNISSMGNIAHTYDAKSRKMDNFTPGNSVALPNLIRNDEI